MASSSSQPKSAAKPPKTDQPTSPSPSPSQQESPSPSPSSPDPSILFSQSESPEEEETTHREDLGDDFGSPAHAHEPAPSLKAELARVARTFVGTATGIAHQVFTAEGSPERDGGLYLADDDDLEGISEPLASLASRRMPADVGNPDLGDLLQLVGALIGYFVKNRVQREQLRAQPASEAPGPTEPPAES